jgi:Rieske Fe-S protein
VHAKHVVMATNVPLHLLQMIDSVKPMRSYAIAAPIPSSYATKHAALWWDNADPYHYVRIMKNEAGTNGSNDSDMTYMLIVGGEDHVTGRDEGVSPSERYKKLENWARVRWPMMGSVSCQWSGQVEEPVDGIAYIGRNPHDNPNVYIVTGDSGQGMTHGTIAANLISDLITKRTNEYEDVYNPKRMPLRATPEYLKQNITTQFQFGRWLAPSDISDIEDLPRCGGAVIREGLQPVAVYKDKDGKIHKCSAVCTHMKGIVRWNDDEKTWDCPVHGSRFTAMGDVVNGPAKEALPPIK